jgi:adenylate cyclase
VSFPVILVKQPGKKALYVQLHESIDVGRDCDGLVVADALVSRCHISLELAGDDVVLTDLGSTNGTFVDGVRVTSAVVLDKGAEVKLGETILELLPDNDPRRTVMFRNTTLVAQEGQIVSAEAASEAADEGTTKVVERRTPLPDEDRGTITIVFSDIVSSTERATALGDVAWMEVLAAHNEIVRRNVEAWRGSVVKTQGDGFMLTFPGVRRALSCMIAIQRDLRELSTQREEFALRIRVGVHTGEAMVSGDDLFGRHVMMAARIAGVADGDEILVSAVVREIASSRGDLKFGEERVVTLKGLGEEQRVYPVLWE